MLTEEEILRQELGSLITALRTYANNLRSLSAYMELDPEVVADQIEEIING
jgi:hypothetical protein